MRVLVVDDSVIFRSMVSKALTGSNGIDTVSVASSGRLALQKLEADPYDVMILDMEMPEMSGMEVLREIRARKMSVKPIIFSSTTISGARQALEALQEGARDIVTKPEGVAGEDPTILVRNLLLPKVLQFAARPAAAVAAFTASSASYAPQVEKSQYTKTLMNSLKPSVLVIASSTGGPNALEAVFQNLKHPPKIPVVIVQHMPPVFTGLLANRLSEVTGWMFTEAKHNEPLLSGRAYIAPGNFHVKIENRATRPVLTLNQEPQRCSVRPSADYLFESAAEVFGNKTLGIVLTGMGEDGLEGTRALKKTGAGIYIQDQASCVVFGMPGAIFADGCYDAIGDPKTISDYLHRFFSGDAI